MPVSCKRTILALWLISCFLSLSTSRANAQCTSSGTIYPASISSVSFPGSDFAFNNPSHVVTSDNQRSSAAAALSLLVGQTEYLQATGFGFAIPPTAIICGIQADIEKRATGIGNILGIEVSWVTDYEIRLIKNGVVTGSNKATAAHWSTAETYHTYGGSLDIWGVGWSPADINAGNFGIAVAASVNGVAALIPNVQIDNIRLTVWYYEILLPSILQHFTVTTTTNNTARLQWKLDDAAINTTCAVQRSADAKTWQTMQPGRDNLLTPGYNGYHDFEDERPYQDTSYYRLMITTASGKTTWSPAKTFVLPPATDLKIYPNPCSSYIDVNTARSTERIIVWDHFGRPALVAPPGGNRQVRLQLQHLPPGAYFIQVGRVKKKIQKW
jgi:hypothetical protein